MGRLIDADTLKYELLADNYNAKMTPREVADCIDNQPTAYDVQNVEEQITSLNGYTLYPITFNCILEIVRKGGIE